MSHLKVSYEVIFKLKSSSVGSSDLLRSILVSWGYNDSDIIEQADRKQKWLSLYCAKPHEVQVVRRRVKKLGLKNVQVHSKTLKAKDWQTVWKKEFKPFTISPSMDIVPTWRKGKYRSAKKRIQIYIDTSVAFGTGMHPTTQFMVQFVEKLKGKCGTVLDIGTGTGILAIAAEKMGAEAVQAVDISPDAVKIAKENVRMNGCGSIGVKIADVKHFAAKERFDLVLANLATDDLIRLKRKIFSLVKKGGYLAVSGISIPNYQLLRNAYASLRLRCLKVGKAKGWTAVLFLKP